MSGPFTEEDLISLEKTRKMRERLADVIMSVEDSALPRKPAELTAVTNLLESIDRSVLGKVKLRIDDETAKDDNAHKDVLRQVLMQMHQTKQPIGLVVENQTAERPVYVPSGSQVQPGETVLRSDTVELPEDLA